MLNITKYQDELKYIWEHIDDGIAVNKSNGKPVACEDIPCDMCMFFQNLKRDCFQNLIDWMFDEAKEGKSD